MMRSAFHIGFGVVDHPRANNENNIQRLPYPRRFTDEQVEEISSLFGKYQRLGKIASWDMLYSEETSLFYAHNGKIRDNYILNIRKFNKDGMFYYATSASLTRTHLVTLNFTTVMQVAREILEAAPVMRAPCIRPLSI